jgi:predicted RNase H-like nuclease (RuvC/YqgF family)
MASQDAIEFLAEQLKKLIGRFEEQQGIINAYVEREREWKALKIEQHNKIEALSKEIEKLNNELNDE